MKRAGLVLWLAVARGLRRRTGAPAPSALPVSGSWSLSQVVQGGGATCGEGGALALTQSGASLGGTFNARGACETSSIAVDFVRSGNVVAGTRQRDRDPFHARRLPIQRDARRQPADAVRAAA